jgi:AmmeMemoRadiSam system protein A
MPSLADSEKQILLKVARRALEPAVERGESLESLPDNANLWQPAGAFVTLRQRKRLRGCIGRMESRDSVISVVAYCARAAASEDPRFRPVSPSELSEIVIELSILSPLEDITLEQIKVGQHGLFVSTDVQRGVLLPQVAVEFRWSAERFLEETCIKAGLERMAWKQSGTRVQAFTTENFSEPDFWLSSASKQQ